MVREPLKKPIDHLKPEGEIEFVDKKPYKPAEKVVATKPQDNLFVSGEFNGNYFQLKLEFTSIFKICNHMFERKITSFVNDPKCLCALLILYYII